MSSDTVISAFGNVGINIDSNGNETDKEFQVYKDTGESNTDRLLTIQENKVATFGSTASGLDYFQIDLPSNRVLLNPENTWEIRHGAYTSNVDIAIRASDDIEFQYGNYSSASIPELRIKNGTALVLACDSSDNVRIPRRLVVGSATAASASTSIDLKDTASAVLLNRVTDANRDFMTPQNGMIIYNSEHNEFQVYQNGGWLKLNTSAVST